MEDLAPYHHVVVSRNQRYNDAKISSEIDLALHEIDWNTPNLYATLYMHRRV